MMRRELLIAGAIVLLALSRAVESDGIPPGNGDLAVVTFLEQDQPRTLAYEQSDDVPVVTMERWPGEIRSDEPAERVQVFGTGLLKVTYPKTRIFAGTHELHLSESEVRDFLAALASSGIPGTDGSDWKAQVRQRDHDAWEDARRRGVTEIVDHRTSETLTIIETRLALADDEEGMSRRSVEEHTFRYVGLESDARRMQDMEHLTTAAEIEGRLLELADRARTAREEER